MQTQNQSHEAVDLVFPIEGRYLARDHAQALKQALCQCLPWLNNDAQAGVHPIKLVPGTDSPALLSRRSLLMLRVAMQRVPQLSVLAGVDLEVSDQRLHLGVPHRRELQAHTTLYAYKVAADSGDEVEFMRRVARELSALGIAGECVCGKHQVFGSSEGSVNTFSLMLHGLAPDQSLRLQHKGIGPLRLLGCGIFIPHKSVAAV